ncbi:hypothetical protein PspLS_08664 [Pyricularia sp. CBS 133598]|nr:hypothetical protein PspLS_08664 [Pyricularia sp. CBS 133598]
MLLAKHIDQSITSSVTYEDLVYTIDGGEFAIEKERNAALFGYQGNGGQRRVITKANNPAYQTAEYKKSRVKPEGIVMKLNDATIDLPLVLGNISGNYGIVGEEFSNRPETIAINVYAIPIACTLPVPRQTKLLKRECRTVAVTLGGSTLLAPKAKMLTNFFLGGTVKSCAILDDGPSQVPLKSIQRPFAFQFCPGLYLE